MSFLDGFNVPVTVCVAGVAGGVAVAPSALPAGVLRPFWRTQVKRTPFEVLLVIEGQLRRPFVHAFHIAGGIWRNFESAGIFAATAIRRIGESVTVGGYVIDDDIEEKAWERLFEEEEET